MRIISIKRKGSGKKHSMKLRLAQAAGGLTLITAGMAAFAAVTMKKEFGRGKYPERRYSYQKRYDPDYCGSHSRIGVSFMSGKNTLRGYIYGTENSSPKGLIVFAHGITVGHESYINQLMWFADRGWRVFAYDATGSATSEGKGTVGLVQSALDLDRALTFAENDERLKDLPVYLLGHSWGGYAVCAALNFDHDIRAAASISGYAYPLKMYKLGTERTVKNITPAVMMFMPYVKGYNRAVARKNAKLNAVDGINRAADVPVLIIHGENDEYVDFGKVSIYCERDNITSPNASYMVLQGRYADHQNFFKTDEANDLTKEFYSRRGELEKKYGGLNGIPSAELEKFMNSFDKERLNEVNSGLLESIEEFFLKAPDRHGGEPSADD